MRTCLWICALAIVTTAYGQTPAKPDRAHFAAERANNVSWSPDGGYLGYSYRAGEFTSDIGIYDLTNGRGRLLLKPEPTEHVEELTWLAGNPIELACISKKTQDAGKEMVDETIWALDGKNMTSKKLWFHQFSRDDNPRISFETSPSLTHAIVVVQTKGATSYYVVTLGATDVVLSSDISQAIHDGQGFAGWTVDGTAFFGGGSKNDLVSNSFTFTLGGGDGGQFLSTGAAQSGTITLQLTGTLSANAGSSILRMLVAKPNIPNGTEGLELMPVNGILRQVRFQGYWADGEAPPSTTQLMPLNQQLSFKDSTGGTRSLWLTPNTKDPKQGILVSPQSEEAWLHPNGRTVAFTLNGVLFVKTVFTQ